MVNLHPLQYSDYDHNNYQLKYNNVYLFVKYIYGVYHIVKGYLFELI